MLQLTMLQPIQPKILPTMRLTKNKNIQTSINNGISNGRKSTENKQKILLFNDSQNWQILLKRGYLQKILGHQFWVMGNPKQV